MNNDESGNAESTEQAYPDLFRVLQHPSIDTLLARIHDLELFTDLAIDLQEEAGLTYALAGWECLLEYSVREVNIELQAKCLYCESNVYAMRGEIILAQAQARAEKLRQSREPQQPNEEEIASQSVQQMQDMARSALIKQRELLFRLKNLEVEHDPLFLSAFLCNYANCLSHVGRTSEAIHQWWTAIQANPENVAALVAYGQGCLHLASFFPRHSTLLIDEAYLAFITAMGVPSGRHVYWGNDVYDRMRQGFEALEKWWALQGVDTESVRERIEKRDKAHEDYDPPVFVGKAASKGLLLTVAPRPISCPNTARDDAYPEALGKMTLKEQQRVTGLLNTIKEDYSLSRFLLYQYRRSSRPLVTYSAITDYATSPTMNEFGLRSALIKSVVRTNIDALDRVAKVLQIILKLDDCKGNPLSFSNVWYSGKTRKRGLRKELRDALKLGTPLSGLYDIHLSWNIEDGPLKSLRNLFVHDLGEVTGYARVLKVKRPNSDSDDELDLFELALESLRILRGAFLMLCQLANKEFYGRNDGPTATFNLGRSHSDKIDLGEEL